VVAAEQASGGLMIAASCTPNDLPAVRMGAQIAAGLKQRATLLVCEDAGVCEATLGPSSCRGRPRTRRKRLLNRRTT
jgi:hypothetical protein